MADINDAKVLGGHVARIMIDGVDAGWFQGVSWSIDMGVQPVFVVGSVEVQEHQQTRYAVSGDLQRYYVRDMMIQNSKLGARTAADVIRTGTFDLVILDTITSKPIQVLEGCTLASAGSGIQAGQLVTQRFSFQALRTR